MKAATTERVYSWLASDHETHDVSVPVPIPTFPLGSVVCQPNEHNDGAIYMAVWEHKIQGTWGYGFGDEVASVSVEGAYYYTTVQPGSVCDNREATPFRPGIIGMKDAGKLEARASIVPDWSTPIVEHDSDENILARDDEWAKLQAARPQA